MTAACHSGRWANIAPESGPAGAPGAEKVLGSLRTHGTLYELVELETTVGRGPECDLVLDGQGISRMHAKILFRVEEPAAPRASAPKQTAPRAAVIDLGSTNGTYVNDVRVQQLTQYGLANGDILRFGQGKRTYWLELPAIHTDSADDDDANRNERRPGSAVEARQSPITQDAAPQAHRRPAVRFSMENGGRPHHKDHQQRDQHDLRPSTPLSHQPHHIHHNHQQYHQLPQPPQQQLPQPYHQQHHQVHHQYHQPQFPQQPLPSSPQLFQHPQHLSQPHQVPPQHTQQLLQPQQLAAPLQQLPQQPPQQPLVLLLPQQQPQLLMLPTPPQPQLPPQQPQQTQMQPTQQQPPAAPPAPHPQEQQQPQPEQEQTQVLRQEASELQQQQQRQQEEPVQQAEQQVPQLQEQQEELVQPPLEQLQQHEEQLQTPGHAQQLQEGSEQATPEEKLQQMQTMRVTETAQESQHAEEQQRRQQPHEESTSIKHEDAPHNEQPQLNAPHKELEKEQPQQCKQVQPLPQHEEQPSQPSQQQPVQPQLNVPHKEQEQVQPQQCQQVQPLLQHTGQPLPPSQQQPVQPQLNAPHKEQEEEQPQQCQQVQPLPQHEEQPLLPSQPQPVQQQRIQQPEQQLTQDAPPPHQQQHIAANCPVQTSDRVSSHGQKPSVSPTEKLRMQDIVKPPTASAPDKQGLANVLQRMPRSTDHSDAALQSDVDVLDGIKGEIKKHLSLYEHIFSLSPGGDVHEGAGSQQQANESLFHTQASSLRSMAAIFASGSKLAGHEETTELLRALCDSRTELSSLSARSKDGDRRWRALTAELYGLREEAQKQKARAQQLSVEHVSKLRLQEQRLNNLQLSARTAMQTGSEGKTGVGAACAAVLQEHLAELQQDHGTLAERLRSAQQEAAEAKQLYEQTHAKAVTLSTLHSVAEEAADRVVERESRACQQRTTLLRRQNELLLKMVQEQAATAEQ